MIRLLGVLLILGGGSAFARLNFRFRQRERRTVEELQYALHRLEREIRCERRPLYPLFTALQTDMQGDARRFFEELAERCRTDPEESLFTHWDRCTALLTLPKEGMRTWRELGRRLAGDAESVERTLKLAAEELADLRQHMERTLPEQQRVLTALCLSGSVILAVVLL